MVRTGIWSIGLAALALVACKKGDESSSDAPKPPPAPLAMSQADPASKSVEFDIQSDGKTTIDMPAPKERIKGETKAAKGELHVDLNKLGMTRGDVLIDLDTFATHTFNDAEK